MQLEEMLEIGSINDESKIVELLEKKKISDFVKLYAINFLLKEYGGYGTSDDKEGISPLEHYSYSLEMDLFEDWPAKYILKIEKLIAEEEQHNILSKLNVELSDLKNEKANLDLQKIDYKGIYDEKITYVESIISKIESGIKLSKSDLSEDILSPTNTAQTQKIILLNELGILAYINTKIEEKKLKGITLGDIIAFITSTNKGSINPRLSNPKHDNKVYNNTSIKKFNAKWGKSGLEIPENYSI